MEKKNIILVVLVFLVGIMWYLFQNNKNNLSFENNLKCAKYIEQQEKEIKEISNLPINAGKIVTAPKVFFSTKLNTCVSTFSITDLRENGFNAFYINNLLNNESIFSEGGRGKLEVEIAEKKYNDKLKELGGE